MMTALTGAAKSGVDVRIITPHIPDKWYVFAVTRHNYMQLVESGVRIYEYTPGFIHAKSFVSDDVYGVVGTVNLDFRSLYLHYECGAWLYKTDSVRQILDDFHAALEKSGEVTFADCKKVSYPRRLGRAVLSVFAPLM
jgi:cardiolipin synthase